jgi:hypothetical protein
LTNPIRIPALLTHNNMEVMVIFLFPHIQAQLNSEMSLFKGALNQPHGEEKMTLIAHSVREVFP